MVLKSPKQKSDSERVTKRRKIHSGDRGKKEKEKKKTSNPYAATSVWEMKVIRELREQIGKGMDGSGEKSLKTKNSMGMKSSERAKKEDGCRQKMDLK